MVPNLVSPIGWELKFMPNQIWGNCFLGLGTFLGEFLCQIRDSSLRYSVAYDWLKKPLAAHQFWIDNRVVLRSKAGTRDVTWSS